jgi:twinkle protein
MRYLEEKGLEPRLVDQHAVARICPFCPPVRNKADNMFKLYVHIESGVFFCHRCGAKGNHWDLKRSLGDVIEPVNWRGQQALLEHVSPSASGTETRSFKTMSENRDRSSSRTTEETLDAVPMPDAAFAAECETRLETSDPVKRYLESRKLHMDIARKYRVGAGRFRFRDDDASAKWSEHDCVTFPWVEPSWLATASPSSAMDRDHRLDENGTEPQTTAKQASNFSAVSAARVLRLKIRSITRKSAMRLEPRGGCWGLFGMHLVPADAECLVLTEGEFDAMAVHQATGLYAVSLPNGARSLPPVLLSWLERFRRIYLWLDDDIPGQEGARQFAHKLGLQRCLLVGSGHGTGPKDANEALLKGHDLLAMIQGARPVPHERIVTFADLRADVQRELANPSQVRGLQSQTLPGLNRLLKGHRRGELSIFSGPTGIGKTTVLSQLSIDYCMQGANTLWGSFELNNIRMAKVMLSQFAAVGPEALWERFDEHADRFEQLPLYFLRFFGSSDVDQVIHAMEYAAYVYDVAHVVLDNLQFMTSGQGRGYERFEIMDRAIEKFRSFATDHNVHVSVVIHPRKEDEDQLLKTASVFGSAKATQEADNVIIIQNGRHYKYLDVRKNRFDGELGHIPYHFDQVTRRIRELQPEEIQQLEDGYQVYS